MLAGWLAGWLANWSARRGGQVASCGDFKMQPILPM